MLGYDLALLKCETIDVTLEVKVPFIAVIYIKRNLEIYTKEVGILELLKEVRVRISPVPNSTQSKKRRATNAKREIR
jgi:hypothetical protein